MVKTNTVSIKPLFFVFNCSPRPRECIIENCCESLLLRSIAQLETFLGHQPEMAAILEAQMPLTPTSSLGSLKDFEMLPEQEVTRPIEDGSPGEMVNVDAIRTALHVIRTERDALTQLEDLYESDSLAQEGLANAVNVISTTINCGGKLIVSGVGKSSKIGLKVVATMNSFGIRSVFLHPTEALHGDLGLIGDVRIFVPPQRLLESDSSSRMTQC